MLSCTAVGDVCAAHFDDESDITLFLPESGAVLISHADAWRALGARAPSSAEPAGFSADLQRALDQLGARLA